MHLSMMSFVGFAGSSTAVYIYIYIYIYICNSYNMGKRDLPDIYALARGPQARGRGHIYQANPDCPCYK